MHALEQYGQTGALMAQIHALTPEGRLPSAAIQHVNELTEHKPITVPTTGAWASAFADDAGNIAIGVDDQARTWLVPHPDTPGLMNPEAGAMFNVTDVPGWAFAITDDAGQVAMGVRDDGTPYAGNSSTTAPYDVVLIIGQSNAQGAGRPVVDTEEWSRIDQYPAANKPEAGHIIPAVDPMQHPGPITANIGHGPALFFSREYALRHPDRRVLIVPASYSGTAFSSPGPDTWDWTDTSAGDNLAIRAVAQTQAALTAAGPGARLAAILWHQGEGDTTNPENYQADLDGLIVWLRDQLDAATVPFIVGQLGYERKTMNAGSLVVDKVHMGTPARHLYTGFARSTPAVHNPGDMTHFSARGQMLMGDAMHDAWERARYNYDQGVAPIGVENLTARRVGDEVRVSWADSWSRATAYVVEWSTDGTPWQETGVEQYAPLDTSATIPATSGVMHIRVTATNSYGSSAPYTIDA